MRQMCYLTGHACSGRASELQREGANCALVSRGAAQRHHSVSKTGAKRVYCGAPLTRDLYRNEEHGPRISSASRVLRCVRGTGVINSPSLRLMPHPGQEQPSYAGG